MPGQSLRKKKWHELEGALDYSRYFVLALTNGEPTRGSRERESREAGWLSEKVGSIRLLAFILDGQLFA